MIHRICTVSLTRIGVRRQIYLASCTSRLRPLATFNWIGQVAFHLYTADHGESRSTRQSDSLSAGRRTVSSAGATCPRTHAAGGSRSRISVRRCSNPASVSRPASSLAAAAEVAAVAPGQRGWDTRAMRPPGRNSRASSRSRAVGSGHMPTVLTASAALNGPSLLDRLSTGV